MSYILDALKRADAERERGTVPGLHARQIPSPTPTNAQAIPVPRWLFAAGTLFVAGLAIAWWVWQTPVQPVHTAALSPNVSSTPDAPQAVVPAPPPPSAPQAASPAPAPARPTALAPVPAKPAHPVSAAAVVSVKPAALPKPAQVASAASVAVTASAPVTPAAPVMPPLLSELPENMRSQIPPLKITGAVHSDHPAERLLLVNNLVLSQGGMAAAGVTLEEIQPRSSVFSFRGTRFRVAH